MRIIEIQISFSQLQLFFLLCLTSSKCHVTIKIISTWYYVSEAGDVNFGNNTMAAVPLKENPSNGNGDWSAYIMTSDNVSSDMLSIRVRFICFKFCCIYNYNKIRQFLFIFLLLLFIDHASEQLHRGSVEVRSGHPIRKRRIRIFSYGLSNIHTFQPMVSKWGIRHLNRLFVNKIDYLPIVCSANKRYQLCGSFIHSYIKKIYIYILYFYRFTICLNNGK